MILAAIGLFFAIRAYGEGLAATAPASLPAAPVPPAGSLASGWLLHLLVTLAAVIVAGRLLGWLFAWFRQPPVIGEVVAGICLGPSLLGALWPAAEYFVLPAGVALVAVGGGAIRRDPVYVLGRIGVQRQFLRRKGHVSLAISHASIVVPFLLGATLRCGFIPTWPAPAFRSPRFRCSSVSRCRSPRSRCSRGSSPIGR